MGVLNWLLGTGTSKVIEAVGTAVNKNIKTIKGDKAEVEAAIADEQLATLAEHAAEFAGRSTSTWFDSLIDGLNRLPRPFITFWALSFVVWPYFDPSGFLTYILSLQMVPETMWTILLAIIGFYMGGRIVSQDLKKPKLTPEEKKAAIEIIKEREQVILENRKPLVVERAPTPKPPPPPWAREIIDRPKIPVIKPDLGKPPEIIKGRPVEVEKMIEALIKREGGFVNDPSDSGGATKYGITQNTLSEWRGTTCTVDDVKKLTKNEASDIYAAEYWLKPGIDSLPIGLMAHTMDAAVNCGPRTGVKMLQQALNSLGAGIREDGLVGPATRSACQKYPEAEIHNKLVDVRVKFYKDLAARRTKDRKFLRGWLIRAESFRVK